MIQQIQNLLDQISDEIMSKPLDTFNGSTIGQHFRHIHDFYDCLSRFHANNEINYCLRQRNPFIEKYTIHATQAFEKVLVIIKSMVEEKEIYVLSDFSTSESEIRKRVKSTVGRELMYAFDHAVHHLAIIKIALGLHYEHIIIDPDIGKAPSTVKYEQRQ